MVSQALIQALAGRNAPPAAQPASRMTTLPVPRTDTQPAAIDPATGRPYQFSTNGSGGENVWTMNGTNLTGANPTTGLGGYSGVDSGGPNVSNITSMGLNQQDWLRSVGYQPDRNDPYGGTQAYNPDTGSIDSTGKVEQYLQSQGITLAEKSGESNGQNRVFQAFRNGQPVGQSFKVKDNEDAFGIAVLAAASVAGAAAAGAAGAGGAGGASAVDGAGGMGLAEGATPASLAGEEAGGAIDGLSASTFEQPAAIAGDSASAVAPTNPALIDSYAGTPGYGVSSAGGGGAPGALGSATGSGGALGSTGATGLTTPQVGGATAGLGGASSGIGSGATNPALIESASGTPGYGVSSAGAGGGVGDLTGITGPTSGQSLGTTLQQLLQNPNGGLSSLGQGLVGLGVGGLTGALGGGDTGLLNSVNYQNAATAQGQSARTNQTNAQGSLTYNKNGVDAQGNPTYSQDVKLNAPYQANLDAALGNQKTAIGNLAAYNKGLPGAYAGVPGVFGDAGTQAGLVKQAQDAAYNSQTQYLDPQYALQQKQLQGQLANQGVNYGSDAYNNAMTQFGSQYNQAYGGARDSAITLGNQYANQLFNQNLAAHNTAESDINNQGTNYLNQSSGALNGVVQNPTFATPPPATPYLGAAQLQGNANLNQYNAKIGNLNNVTNGLTGIAGSLLSNPNVTNGLGNLFSGAGSAIGGLFGGGG